MQNYQFYYQTTMENNKYKGGVLKDTREESEKTYHQFIGGLVNWTETATIPGVKPAQRNQEGSPDSSSCVCITKRDRSSLSAITFISKFKVSPWVTK